MSIKSLKVDPSQGYESGFSPTLYGGVSVVAAIVAERIFSTCRSTQALLAAASLGLASLWYFWSATIILLNRLLGETPLQWPLRYLHAAAMETNSVVNSTLLFPLTFFKSYHNPSGTSKNQPVFLVNGYLSFGSNLHYLKTGLADAGFGPVYSTNIGTGCSIKHYARQVQEIIKELGVKKIALIGHSKGGLVCAHYATHLANKDDVTITSVISISSPFKGSTLSKIGLGQDAQDMSPNSKYLMKHFPQFKTAAENIPFCQIASEMDIVVGKKSALALKTGRELVLKDLGHLGLIFSSRVLIQICTWLSETK